MSPDFRYHVASLAAVFLALGIGILVGTAFVGAPVVERQTTLIRRLEANVGELRRETREKDRSEEALRRTLPAVISGRLNGKRVLILQTGAYANATDQTEEALKLAGATVVRAVLPPEAWRETADSTASPAPPSTVSEDVRLLTLALTGQDTTGLVALREKGRITGDELPREGFRYVVLVGGGLGTASTAATTLEEPWATVLARNRDIALATELAANGVTIVGTEPYDAGVSFLQLFASAGVPYVDCIDRPLGKMALPFALLGEKGTFGLKEASDQPLPATIAAHIDTPFPTPSPMPLP